MSKAKPTKAELAKVLKDHAEWLSCQGRGTRANLTRADLTDADLTGANLTRANLTGADLTGADLTGADLTGADLTRANLTRADLTGADLTRADLTRAYLTGADLTDADLTRANLTRAYLTRADLTGADLTGADLTGADLTGADLTGAKNLHPVWIARTLIAPEGTLRVYKRLVEGVAVLQIPEHARRSNATGRKCRASEAIVLELPEGVSKGHSLHDPAFVYLVGAIVKPTSPFVEDRWQECASGIHFYLTREEAEAHV